MWERICFEITDERTRRKKKYCTIYCFLCRSLLLCSHSVRSVLPQKHWLYNESFHWNCRKSTRACSYMWKWYIKMLLLFFLLCRSSALFAERKMCVQTSGAWNFILSINYPNNIFQLSSVFVYFCSVFPLYSTADFLSCSFFTLLLCHSLCPPLQHSCYCLSSLPILFTQTDGIVVTGEHRKKFTRQFVSVFFIHFNNCLVV